MRVAWWLPFLGVVVCACQTGPESRAEPAGASPAAAGPARTMKRYGDRITSEGAPKTELASVLAKPADFNGRAVTTEGEVRRSCTRKGCWMELATGMDESKPGCRVRFKNYGFFIPLDSAGAHARVQGVVQVRQVPAPIVEEMQGEGAHFANKHADGSADEVQMVASGVELVK